MSEAWLVTGGCGFLGANLAAALVRDGTAVTVLDNLTRTGASENLAWLSRVAGAPGAGRCTFVHDDVRSRSDVEDLFRRQAAPFDVVAHLAGQVAMTTSLERPRYDFEVNVGGTVNVLEAVRTCSPGTRVLFSSTNKVYGDLERLPCREESTRWILPELPHGVPESTPLDFCSPYGCSKGAADQYCVDYHRMYGLRTIVFRHGSMYGGRQFSTFDQGWVGWFCLQAAEQQERRRQGRPVEPFTIQGDGKQVRDLLWVDDAVACYRRAAAVDGAVGQVFNIGGGPANSLSLLELFALLEERLGGAPAYRRLPVRA
ncbi:MAG TPA: NAD-dependent epimerase/dehydratase family protein, partial [Myxococcota bacterium]|nr:NAD-dependent epimerase/dehydratase family protein [Myxococcota bacterium]